MKLKSIFAGAMLAVAFLVGGSFLQTADLARAALDTETYAEATINVNSSEAEELQAIRGIGPALAERIVLYRQANGDFMQIEDITQVRGIGAAKYDKIKTQIAV